MGFMDFRWVSESWRAGLAEFLSWICFTCLLQGAVEGGLAGVCVA